MSGYRFRQMEDAEATQISGWHYEPPYDFYDARSDPDDLRELLDPKLRKDAYFSVFDEGGVLVGFFQFARERFSPEGFTLSVATFNERAIRVYERAGFKRDTVYKHNTNGGEYPFLSMARDA